MARERVGKLAADADAGEALPKALEELRTTLEELNVANEELREQYEQLEATENEREAERRRYLELFELAPDAYLVTDRTHRIVDANRAAAALLARRSRTLVGKPLATLVPLGERRAFRARLSELERAAAITGWELRLQPAGGEPVPVSVTVGPASDERAAPLGHRWIIRDESESERARRALDESESRYRAIVETAVDGIVTIDAAGMVQTMNPAAARMFGYDAGEVVGRNVSMLMPPPWREEHDGYLERYRRTGERRIIGIGREVRGRRKDGTTFPVELAVSEFRDETGPMFAATIRDLTESRAHEEAQRLFEDMIAATGDLMASVDRDYVYRAVNDAYAAAFARKREAIVGRTVPEVLGEAFFEEAVKPTLDECLAGAPAHFERWFESPARGRLYLDVRYSPHRDESGAITGVVVDARDRTATKRLQEEAERHQAELTHVARLSTLGELASGLAHELNQPLAAIASYCDAARRLVARRGIEPEALVETLEACGGQARRAGEIIRRLRSLVRRDRGVRAAVDVNELVANVLRLAESEARRKRVALDAVLGNDLPDVRADDIQVEQVLLNLVRNAVEAIEGAGSAGREVTVRTRAIDSEAVEVCVEDTGPGLSAEAARALFEPFFTTKEDGIGIGLAICRTIVEAHDGRLSAETRAEGGARLCFTLPAGRREDDE